jgi:hypothetical protein
VTASGYLAGETVAFYLHSTPVFVGTANASGRGLATITFTIPAGFTGEHHIVGTGETSGVVSTLALHIPAGATVQSISESGGLSFTGAASAGLVAAAVILLGAGTLLLFAGRRKSKHAVVYRSTARHAPRHAGGELIGVLTAGELTRKWWLTQAAGPA